MRNDVDELNSRAASFKPDLMRAISRIDTANELDYTKVRENMKTVIGKLEETSTMVYRMRDVVIREFQTVGGNRRKFNARLGILGGKFLEQEAAIYGSESETSLGRKLKEKQEADTKSSKKKRKGQF